MFALLFVIAAGCTSKPVTRPARDEARAEPARAAFSKDEFILGFKNASVPVGQATWGDYLWIDPVSSYAPPAVEGRHWAEGRRYVIENVKPIDADTFYARLSNWVFMMAVKGHENADSWTDTACYSDACGGAYGALKNFTVINENPAEMLLKGRV